MTYPAISRLPGRPVSAELCRFVERAVLERLLTPDFLFTSGRPGRYNTRGIQAVYASEDQPTAGAEAERYRNGRVTQNLVYWVHPTALVFDILEIAANLNALGLTTADLYTPWMFAKIPTKTQLLGSDIAAQTRLAGIRFPSNAARDRGFAGYNLVFFKDALVSPRSLIVRDGGGNIIQQWP